MQLETPEASSRPRPFRQVDVFTAEPYFGNPLAVVLDSESLNESQMARFTRWMNLSETTFLLPPTTPEADYRVRIFTPQRELPFAGHPTLGSCHAWLEAGGQPKRSDSVIQECKTGLIQIRRDGRQLAFAGPPLVRSGPVDADTLARIVRGLGVRESEVLHHGWVDNGPGWLAVMLPSAEQVLSLEPDHSALKGLALGVIGSYPPGSECLFEVRAFVSSLGVPEDPVTGSLNAGLGQWLVDAGLAPHRYVASQGTVLGRAGRVHIMRDEDGQIWVGGESVTCVEGMVAL
ncbi:MAG: PhzF family phenazine biosynthesis protein [Thermaceae bacterium]|nr:PhzF family phenazine biosynthesis protein [Thermaceae bacterium]